MSYDFRAELARNVDGLSRSPARARWRLIIAMMVSLVLVVLAMMYLRDLAEAPVQKEVSKQEERTPPETGDAFLFRDMGFLRQAKRADAPEILSKTLDSRNHSLKQHTGKIVLINFWATWCQPCVREMPSIERLYQKYKARGFEIVAVSLDQSDHDEVRAFAEKLNLTFPIVLDPEHKVKALYKVRGLPTTYLVDKKGQVAGYGVGPREWDNEAAYALVGHLLNEKN